MPNVHSSAVTLKRIHREIADLKKEDLGPIVLTPRDDNLYLWKGSIPGPEGSVYEGGVFNFEVLLPPDYPFSAPKVVFKTRIYHMNISEQGHICIDILKANWSPALSLFKVVLSLSSLLTDPNPKDPLVPSIANQYLRNRKAHDNTARQWTELYARPKPPPPALQVPASARAQGKMKMPSEQTHSSQHTSTSTSASRRELITIEDSDDEFAAGQPSRKRKREAVRVSEGEDAILIDNEEQGSSKKRNIASRRTARSVVGTTGSTNHQQARRQHGEVIVIDD